MRDGEVDAVARQRQTRQADIGAQRINQRRGTRVAEGEIVVMAAASSELQGAQRGVDAQRRG